MPDGAASKIRRPPRCRPVKLDWNENRLISLYRDLPRDEQHRVVDAASLAWKTGWKAGVLACQAPKRNRKARKVACGANVIAFPRGER